MKTLLLWAACLAPTAWACGQPGPPVAPPEAIATLEPESVRYKEASPEADELFSAALRREEGAKDLSYVLVHRLDGDFASAYHRTAWTKVAGDRVLGRLLDPKDRPIREWMLRADGSGLVVDHAARAFQRIPPEEKGGTRGKVRDLAVWDAWFGGQSNAVSWGTLRLKDETVGGAACRVLWQREGGNGPTKTDFDAGGRPQVWYVRSTALCVDADGFVRRGARRTEWTGVAAGPEATGVDVESFEFEGLSLHPKPDSVALGAPAGYREIPGVRHSPSDSGLGDPSVIPDLMVRRAAGGEAADLRKGKVLVFFWTPWAATNAKVLPAVEALARTLAKEGWRLAPVCVWSASDSSRDAALREAGCVWDTAVEGEILAESLGVGEAPVMVVAEEGRALARLHARELGAKDVVERVRAAAVPTKKLP